MEKAHEKMLFQPPPASTTLLRMASTGSPASSSDEKPQASSKFLRKYQSFTMIICKIVLKMMKIQTFNQYLFIF